jgi:hypothetical protein
MKGQILAMMGAVSVVMLTGCSQSMAQSPGHGAMATSMATTSGIKAAQLRAGLNNLFSEHVYLVGAATSAALGGREAEFKAAAGAEKAFLPLWRRRSSPTS